MSLHTLKGIAPDVAPAAGFFPKSGAARTCNSSSRNRLALNRGVAFHGPPSLITCFKHFGHVMPAKAKNSSWRVLTLAHMEHSPVLNEHGVSQQEMQATASPMSSEVWRYRNLSRKVHPFTQVITSIFRCPPVCPSIRISCFRIMR